MVLDKKNKNMVIAFKESLHKQVAMRLCGNDIKKTDIDRVVNFIFNRVKGEYVDARFLNSVYHQALVELGIGRSPIFASSRFPAKKGQVSAMKK
jgi:hypothetical protein